MGQGASVTLVIVLAMLAANWPFITERLFGVIKLASPKSLALRLVELIVLFFVIGGVALALEQRLGQIAPQKWEFYAVAASVFLTLAFPGFVWRYLVKRKSA
jgi:putative effector of murein hydrolase LrgA (UPF0299 family)